MRKFTFLLKPVFLADREILISINSSEHLEYYNVVNFAGLPLPSIIVNEI